MRCGDSADQWDFAVHREFPMHESLKLQFRAEMFNVLNHPNFGPPVGDLGYPGLTPSSASQSRCWGRALLEAILGRARSIRSIKSAPVPSVWAKIFLLPPWKEGAISIGFDFRCCCVPLLLASAYLSVYCNRAFCSDQAAEGPG